MKFTIHAYTPQAPDGFPENTWDATMIATVAQVVHNCAKRTAGIWKIEIIIDEPHDEPSQPAWNNIDEIARHSRVPNCRDCIWMECEASDPNMSFAKCTHPQTQHEPEVNIVSGQVKATPAFCDIARNIGKCGREARLFQRIDQPIAPAEHTPKHRVLGPIE